MNHIGTIQMNTQRMNLRKFHMNDLKHVYKNWASDQDVQNGYSEPVYDTLDKTKELLKKYIAGYESEDYYRWAIIDKESDQCIGQIAFFTVDNKNEFCEIEYCIAKKHQNKGLTTEAVKSIVEFGFNQVGFNRIQISCRNANLASKRVIEKCGFTYEGNLRQYFYHDGAFQDRLYFSILKHEHLND